ncbi:MAG: glycosyltransferase family 9 protein [candidate division NC10 bacterium]|nr:glycosyltransferase family 9 protein [candidate division NC10 bacterium]
MGQIIRGLRRRRFDLAIAMGRPCSRSSAWLAYASGAPWRVGYSTSALQPFPFFLNLGCDPGAMTSHEVEGCLELLASLGIPSAGRALTLVPDPDVQTAVRHRLTELGAAPEAGLALVHISNRRETSRWPLASFAQAADALRERLGLVILLSWSPGDAQNPLFPGDDGKAEEVARDMRARPILLRTPELRELIADVSLCDFVLSTDGGLMHIAAALDIPQVVLFGKTGPEHWAPVTEKGQILRSGGRADRISVAEVVAASVEVMSRWGRGKTFAAAPGTTGRRMTARGATSRGKTARGE